MRYLYNSDNATLLQLRLSWPRPSWLWFRPALELCGIRTFERGLESHGLDPVGSDEATRGRRRQGP